MLFWKLCAGSWARINSSFGSILAELRQQGGGSNREEGKGVRSRGRIFAPCCPNKSVVAGRAFTRPRRERPEVRRQLGVRVADSLVEPCPRGGRVGAADQADEFAIDLRQLFQPLQVQEAAEEAVGIGQQHRLNIADGRRRHFRRRQRLRVEQRLKVEVRGTDARGVWVHLFIARQRAGVAQSVVDIGGQTCGARRGMQNEADRHGDAEHLLEQQRQATAPKESPPRSP